MSHHHIERRSSRKSLPTPWEVSHERRRPSRAAILRALYEHRGELRAQYPHLILPARPHPAPVVVLLDLWREWDLAHAPCGSCGGIGLLTSFGGGHPHGWLRGVCIACTRVLRRDLPGGMWMIQSATTQLRARHRFTFFASFAGSWLLKGAAQGVVAVLQEIGDPNLYAREGMQL